MFLRIFNVYLIIKHSHQKPKPFGIEINIDLEATIVEVKLDIYMAHSYPIWIKYSEVILSLVVPFYPQRKQSQWGNDGLSKNRLRLA